MRHSAGNAPLIEPLLRRKLEHLVISTRRRFPGRLIGERRSARQGTSIEFSDFRDYSPGDDLRYVDWRAFARLEKLILKVFIAEEELSLHLLIDNSPSMGFGAPTTKWRYAQRLAAMIGFIGLAGQDRVHAGLLSSACRWETPVFRGRPSIGKFIDMLTALPDPDLTSGESFALSSRRYVERARTPGIAFVFSDFFDSTVREGLQTLLSRRYQVVMIHVLDRAEVSPDIMGDFQLIDSESGELRDVLVTPASLEEYEAGAAQFFKEIESLASQRRMDYVRFTTDQAVEQTGVGWLRRAGLIGGRGA